MSARLTTIQAIDLECRQCQGNRKGNKICMSKICKLNDTSLSPKRRIKAHCLDCAETQEEVRACTHKPCYLYMYRLGGV